MKIKVPRSKKERAVRTPIDERIPKVSEEERDAVAGGVNVGTGTRCPYCSTGSFVKRGTRKKKHERVQLYLCRNTECGRTFTSEESKGRRYPIKLVIEGMSYYNLGFTLKQTCKILKQKFKTAPDEQSLAKWIEQYKSLCRYERMRPYAVKLYKPLDVIECVTLVHKQLYNFRYHRAKIRFMLEEYKNRDFRPLKDFLDSVASETPHQCFLEGERMSEIRSKFGKADMIVKSKKNYANYLTDFALKGARSNKLRHDTVQRFMIANDSVTVATEVPVVIRREDIEHMERQLGFEIVGEEGITFRRRSAREEKKKSASGSGKEFQQTAMSARGHSLPKLLTGHIDLVQIRNGAIHILDYKPNAAKEKPIEQLTWYALALSRLTGLRVFCFKCAWFDEKDYFEFFPLHVVKKLSGKKAGKRRRVEWRDGTKAAIPRFDKLTIV
jgi:transposase-like protein